MLQRKIFECPTYSRYSLFLIIIIITYSKYSIIISSINNDNKQLHYSLLHNNKVINVFAG